MNTDLYGMKSNVLLFTKCIHLVFVYFQGCIAEHGVPHSCDIRDDSPSPQPPSSSSTVPSSQHNGVPTPATASLTLPTAAKPKLSASSSSTHSVAGSVPHRVYTSTAAPHPEYVHEYVHTHDYYIADQDRYAPPPPPPPPPGSVRVVSGSESDRIYHHEHAEHDGAGGACYVKRNRATHLDYELDYGPPPGAPPPPLPHYRVYQPHPHHYPPPQSMSHHHHHPPPPPHYYPPAYHHHYPPQPPPQKASYDYEGYYHAGCSQCNAAAMIQSSATPRDDPPYYHHPPQGAPLYTSDTSAFSVPPKPSQPDVAVVDQGYVGESGKADGSQTILNNSDLSKFEEVEGTSSVTVCDNDTVIKHADLPSNQTDLPSNQADLHSDLESQPVRESEVYTAYGCNEETMAASVSSYAKGFTSPTSTTTTSLNGFHSNSSTTTTISTVTTTAVSKATLIMEQPTKDQWPEPTLTVREADNIDVDRVPEKDVEFEKEMGQRRPSIGMWDQSKV